RDRGLVLVGFDALAAQTPRWLVKGVLQRDQSGVLAGPLKTAKTSIAFDLALSVASGTDFLGAYPVVEPLPVAVFSGESGGFVARDTLARIARARSLPAVPPATMLGVCDLAPDLADPLGPALLAATLAAGGFRLVVIDPLYFCLGGVDVTN